MKAKRITVGIEGSVKVAEYQYIKPMVSIEFELDGNEKPGDVMKIARERSIKELRKIEQDIIKEWKGKEKSDIPF